MASELDKDKINVACNPFGAMFHPQAIAVVFNRIMDEKLYTPDDFFNWDGYWFCFEHHSSMAETKLAFYIDKSNALLKETKRQLQTASALFLTFGSAWGYTLNGQVVANCHQQSSSLFRRNISTSDELYQSMHTAIQKVKILNKDIAVILTVSPVRHLKDGVVENQRSKSLLNLLCHQLSENINVCVYFPSYEFMIDELRDYSFYKRDKVHPNGSAIGRLYEFFTDHFMDKESLSFINDWRALNCSIQHRSLRQYSRSNSSFKKSLKNKLLQFQENYRCSCESEIASLTKDIAEIEAKV